MNQKLQDQIIRNNEERYRHMIDEIQDYAIFLLTKEGVIHNWNKGAFLITGFSASEIIGKSFHICYTQEDIDKKLPEKLLQKSSLEGKAIHEGWNLKKDGTRYWANSVITALHHDDEVTGYVKVIRDMTAMKEASDRQNEYIEQLRRSEERYHNMIQEVQDYAILMLDQEGIIQNWNYGAQQIKGYSADEVVGKHFRIFYTPQDVARKLPEKMLRMAAEKGRAAAEGYRVRKDGNKFWGSIVITALHDRNGNIIGYSKLTRDLTDKKIAEEKIKQYAAQLEHKNAELEEFSYVASHDLKEPLRKIITFGDLLRYTIKENADERVLNYVTRMQHSAGRMMSLIDDLLQLSRIGRGERQFEETDLDEVLRGVMQDLEPAIEQRHAEIKADPLPRLMAKPLQMQQLFQNLLTNALKFNESETPRITISNDVIIPEGSTDHHCQITVADNGIGFEAENAARIFEPFQRLHGRSEYAGSGIGLAICKKIVEFHNGTITARSEPGKGSAFTITLPCEQPQHLI